MRQLLEDNRDRVGADLVVFSAGKQQERESLADITDEQFDETYKTNVYALFWICRAALPHLPPGASIINTSSIQAYEPSAILADYASTKAAINTFSKALAQQVASKGIRVNVVAPGPVWTPLQEVGGQPAEPAPPYVFLASPESSYVSGETLSVTGGMPTP